MEKRKDINEKTRIYNVIIMDRSGSMWDIQKAAIMGYNEVLSGVKRAAMKFIDTQEHFFSLLLFDSESIEELYWNVPVQQAKKLSSKTYIPGACTPLYDAIGHCVTKLKKEVGTQENISVMITIITDGYENDSKEYDLKAVRRLIDQQKSDGWTFAYIGTDHDVESVTIGLSISNVIKFEKTEEETRKIFARECQARERVMENWHEFNSESPCASEESRKEFRKQMSENFYKED